MYSQTEYYDESNTDTIDTNQSFYDSWRQSQPSIPRPNTATPTNNPIHVPEIRSSLNRQTVDDSIDRFSRLWAPTRDGGRSATVPSPSKSDTMSSVKSNSSKMTTSPNGFSAGTPLSIEVDPNAWELPPEEAEAEFQKLIGNTRM